MYKGFGQSCVPPTQSENVPQEVKDDDVREPQEVSRVVAVKVLSVDGAQGEFEAGVDMTIRSLLKRFDEQNVFLGVSESPEIIQLHRFPKTLTWNGMNLLSKKTSTLGELGFYETDMPIQFTPFTSLSDMISGILADNSKIATLENEIVRGATAHAEQIRDKQLASASGTSAMSANFEAKFKAVLLDFTLSAETVMYYFSPRTMNLFDPYYCFATAEAQPKVADIVPAICYDRLDVVVCILKKYPDIVNAVCDDRHGRAPLFYAVKFSGDDMVRHLITAGARIHKPDKKGRSAMHLAASMGLLSTLKIMLEKDKLNERQQDDALVDSDGRNIFHAASINGRSDTVAYLLSSLGSDIIHLRDSKGFNALHLAAQCGHTAVVKLLVTHKRGTDQQFNVNEVDKVNRTALHRAAYFGCAAVVRMLFDLCPDIDPFIRDNDGCMAITTAAKNGHVATVASFDMHFRMLK